MKLKSYPEYKDSGVAWLGPIPEHWEIMSLKQSVEKIDIKADENTLLLPFIGLENIESWTGKFIESDSEEMSEGNLFKLSDILFGKLRPYLAKVLAPDHQGRCTSEILVLRPKRLDRKYLFYYCLSHGFIRIVDSSTFGTKMPRADWQFVGHMPVAFSSLEEQKIISRFLDRETARIDALIEKKQKQIELLQEKRTALITQAVTKGLDPSVPMKDSGVEWLGQIPEHWEVRRLKYLVNFYGGGTPSKEIIDFWNGDIPWVSPKDMKIHKIFDSPDKITLEAVKQSSTNFINPGALLMVVRSGILNHSIPVAIAGCKLTLNQDMKALIPNSLAEAEYLLRLIEGYQKSLLIEWRKEGATVESLEFELVANSSFPLPPKHEQSEIISYLDREIEKIDALVNKIQEGIELLKEYRTALITAAVTGKIDVRQEVA